MSDALIERLRGRITTELMIGDRDMHGLPCSAMAQLQSQSARIESLDAALREVKAAYHRHDGPNVIAGAMYEIARKVLEQP